MTEPLAADGVAPLDEVNERLPFGRTVMLGAQHLLAMYASIAAAPLALGAALGIDQQQLIYLLTVTALMSGIATIIQSAGVWKIGARLPLVQGTTFAAVAPMILIGGQWGWPAIFGSVIAAGIFGFLAAPLFSKVLFLFPPVVIGTTVTAIGLSLIPIALSWMNGGDGNEDALSYPDLALAGFTIAVILVVTRLCKGFLGQISVMVGLAVGTVAALILGRVDFSGVGTAGWFQLVKPFEFGAPQFKAPAIAAMCLVMLISMVENTSNSIAIGKIAHTPIDDKRVAAAIRADGLGSALGGVFNAFPFTAYAQNVSLIQLTNVKSRWAITAAGVLLVIIGFLPKVSAVVAAIPSPVLGGAALVLFGGVAAVGISFLGSAKLDEPRNMLIVSVSLGLALMPVLMPTQFASLPSAARTLAENSIVIACVSAIVLNLLLNVLGRSQASREHADEDHTNVGVAPDGPGGPI